VLDEDNVSEFWILECGVFGAAHGVAGVDAITMLKFYYTLFFLNSDEYGSLLLSMASVGSIAIINSRVWAQT